LGGIAVDNPSLALAMVVGKEVYILPLFSEDIMWMQCGRDRLRAEGEWRNSRL
jgi:hypothetical protein